MIDHCVPSVRSWVLSLAEPQTKQPMTPETQPLFPKRFYRHPHEAQIQIQGSSGFMRMGLGVVTALSSFFPIPQPSTTKPKNTSEKPATNKQPPGLRTQPDAQQTIKNHQRNALQSAPFAGQDSRSDLPGDPEQEGTPFPLWHSYIEALPVYNRTVLLPQVCKPK